MKTVGLIGILLAAGIATANAQAVTEAQLAAIPGSVKPWGSSGFEFNPEANVTRAEMAAVAANIDKLFALFQATPVLAKPMGFSVVRWRGAAHEDWRMKQRDALRYSFGMTYLWHWVREGETQVHVAEGEGSGPTIAINDYSCVLENGAIPELSDDTGDMYYAPILIDQVNGYPRYKSACVVMTKIRRPLFVPVPQERVLRVLIRKLHEKDVDLAPARAALQSDTAALNLLERTEGRRVARIRNYEKLLAGMTAAQRAAPSFITWGDSESLIQTPFVPETDPHALAVVIPNPDFFDRAVPRTEIQLIATTFGCWARNPVTGEGPSCEEEREKLAFGDSFGIHRAVIKQLDWNVLRALLAGN